MRAVTADLRATRDALARGRLRAADLVAELLARADELDPRLGVYLSRFDDAAMARARELDARRAAGGVVGPLHGVPVSLKDMIASREGPTTAHSRVPARFAGGRDAEVVRRLRAAGAIVIGKVTLAEFGFGPPDPGSGLPLPRNPWDRDRWPGGSSSGSAAGVAAGLFPASVGTDTGGSIRIPAALCGVTGFKPSAGSVPVDGVIAGAPSLDAVGPVAATAADCELLWEVMTSAAGEPAAPPARLRVAVETAAAVRPGADPACAAAVDAAAEVLRAAGADVTRVELPYADDLVFAGRIVQGAETFAEHREDLARHWSAYGPATRLQIAAGAFRTPADVERARAVREHGRAAVHALLSEHDVVLGPTVAAVAPRHGTDLVALMGLFNTSLWNVTGGPAISVPGPPGEHGLPLGLQLAARPGDDRLVLAVARLLQERTGWHLRRPSP